MNRTDDLFLDYRQAAAARQMRMSRLQVFNWGTFSDLHDIPVTTEGFLFVGRSGSGKSTLLDAIASLQVPPQWLAFNSAAREGDGGRHDRSLASYVRGAWADLKDAQSGDIATHYLRTGTTWSALAVEFANSEGRIVNLVQLYWLRGASNRNADVRKHFILAERSFSIADELDGFDLDVRSLKQRLPDVHHFDRFRAYGSRFRSLLSIESDLALKLLHKTQSAKNLGDLNTFLRDFMLEPPATFDVADRLVAEFAELDAAHRAVVNARRQADTLGPARTAYERAENIDGELTRLDALLQIMDAYRDRRRGALLEAECVRLQRLDDELAGIEEQQRALHETLAAELAALRDRHREQGGGRIEDLQRRHAEGEEERIRREKRLGEAASQCRQLGYAGPADPRTCAELTARARDEIESFEAADASAEDTRDTWRDDLREKESGFHEARREIEAMQAQPSNIPARMIALRRALTDHLGLREDDLPFVGELIQVADGESTWTGAAERVLHGFALSMLVEEKRYAAVSRYVEETHLGQRLIYYRVGRERTAFDARLHPQSLLRKLDIRQGAFEPWVRAELARRFDYACVDNLKDFRGSDRALTRAGQVRHSASRHEKDDRHAIDDRSRWVLGFDNREKLALFKARAASLGEDISRLQAQLAELDGQRRERRQRLLLCRDLASLQWRDIDVASVLDRLQAITRSLEEIHEKSTALRELGERIASRQRHVDQAQKQLNDTRVERGGHAREINRHQAELAELDARLDGISLDAEVVEALDQRFDQYGATPKLADLDNRRAKVEKAINGERESHNRERAALVRDAEKRFVEFRRQWPMEAADLDDSFASAPGFLKLLNRLERDGLPRHEQRFFDLLKEQSSENLAALNTHMVQARKQIYERMEVVNAGLAEAEFNPGTHLQIEVADRHLPDVREFREQVRQVLEHAWQMDREDAESRFTVLRDLVYRLGGAEGEHQRWRALVLDVRLHVEFVGRELNADKAEVEIYRSGAGKSGGQREKLATTCLAAALRYQLGGSSDDLPAYAAVVLDEAFGKADNEFTELAMKIFRKFGFQMIVATPLKSVMTLEPFIGGACFVDIAERKRSATLQIEYDRVRQRLNLPERAGAQSAAG